MAKPTHVIAMVLCDPCILCGTASPRELAVCVCVCAGGGRGGCFPRGPAGSRLASKFVKGLFHDRTQPELKKSPGVHLFLLVVNLSLHSLHPGKVQKPSHIGHGAFEQRCAPRAPRPAGVRSQFSTCWWRFPNLLSHLSQTPSIVIPCVLVLSLLLDQTFNQGPLPYLSISRKYPAHSLHQGEIQNHLLKG